MSRLELHDLLITLLGSNNVYYQPPESVRMSYPAIKYKVSNITTKSANDSKYLQNTKYEIIVMDKTPDNKVIEKLLKLQMCSHDRHYESDGLNHDVFTLFI